MGPDLSDGIIIEIDEQRGIIYIDDRFHEDMIVRYELSNYRGNETFSVGESVIYPLLYDDYPTAAGLYREKDFSNPVAQQHIHESKISA